MKKFTRMALLAVILASLFAETAGARPAKRVPLMPKRFGSVVRAERSTYATPRATGDSGRFRFGIELGFLARKNATEGTTLGMQWMRGGRITMDYALNYRWYLEPSLGYFQRSEGEAASSVSEHNFELGANLLYDLMPDRNSTIRIGLASRLDGLVSTITILNSSETVPLTFRFRAGPRASAHFFVGSATHLTLGVEAPLEIPTLRIFSSVTLGVMTRF